MTTLEHIQEHQRLCDVTRETMKEKGVMGPWIDEPDRLEFEHAGLKCLLSRVPGLFHWCGYVGIEKNHPYMKRRKENDPDLDVHGGITYSDECREHICHVSDNDKLFWFGFDCSHFRDYVPGMALARLEISKEPSNLSTFETYKSVHYAKNQTMLLAEQLQSLK